MIPENDTILQLQQREETAGDTIMIQAKKKEGQFSAILPSHQISLFLEGSLIKTMFFEIILQSTEIRY